MKFILLLFFLIVCKNAISGTIDPQTPDEKYVEYAKDFKYVLKICGEYQDNSPFCASAVAIKPNWILTAAHVVKDYKVALIQAQDKKVIEIETIVHHKDFEAKKFGYCDIALGYVKQDLNLEFYPEIYEKDDEVGKVCCIAGWGSTGTFSTGAQKHDGLRRAGSNRVDSIDRNLLICTPSLSGRTSLEFLISHGDSGGGLFIDNKLAGINSCVMAVDKKPNSNYSDEAGHTRLSLFKNWINEQIEIITKEKNLTVAK